MKVLDTRLEGRDFIMGKDYSIADMAVWPWVINLEKYHKSYDALGVTDSKNITAWLERTEGRPASQRAINIPPRP